MRVIEVVVSEPRACESIKDGQDRRSRPRDCGGNTTHTRQQRAHHIQNYVYSN
jgi:hypothetical protein